jgi:hypothetical protein
MDQRKQAQWVARPLDDALAYPREEPRQLQHRVDDHHAEQEDQRAQVQRALGGGEVEHAEHEHCACADHGNRSSVQPQTGHFAQGQRDEGEQGNDDRAELRKGERELRHHLCL